MKQQRRKLIYWTISLISITAIIYFAFFVPRVTCSSNIVFGKPTSCMGRGICTSLSGEGAPAPAINVNFDYDPLTNKLSFNFKQSDQRSSQPGQNGNFVDGGRFKFDLPFLLDNPNFSALRVPSDLMIGTGNDYSVSVSGFFTKIVTAEIVLTRMVSVSSNIVFGTAPGCTGRGICSCTPGAIAGSVPVKFSVDPANRGQLIMSFIKTGLPASQLGFFSSGSYMFSTDFQLPAFVISALGLPAGTMIKTSSTSNVQIIDNNIYNFVQL